MIGCSQLTNCASARQRPIAVEGDGAAVLRQAREVRHQHVIGRRQHDQVVAAVFLIDADDVEQVEREAHQIDVVILLGDGGSQRLGCRRRWSASPAGGRGLVPAALN